MDGQVVGVVHRDENENSLSSIRAKRDTDNTNTISQNLQTQRGWAPTFDAGCGTPTTARILVAILTARTHRTHVSETAVEGERRASEFNI